MAREAGRKETEGGTRVAPRPFVPFVAKTWVFRHRKCHRAIFLDYRRFTFFDSRIVALSFVLRIIDRAEFFRLPRFRCIIQFAGGIFIRIVLCPRVERVGGGGGGRGEFIPGRKVVCRADHGVKSRKIGGPAGCPSQYAPYSESRQIGSTSKTILAENCSTNPYIKCPGYRARSREQGQPRP